MLLKKQNMTKKYLNDLTYKIIGAAIEVHKTLGSGLLESVYHKCMKQELLLRKIDFLSDFIVPVSYKGILINFNCVDIFKEGQKTYVNKLFRDLPEE